MGPCVMEDSVGWLWGAEPPLGDGSHGHRYGRGSWDPAAIHSSRQMDLAASVLPFTYKVGMAVSSAACAKLGVSERQEG